jgi:hypothetical protein
MDMAMAPQLPLHLQQLLLQRQQLLLQRQLLLLLLRHQNAAINCIS